MAPLSPERDLSGKKASSLFLCNGFTPKLFLQQLGEKCSRMGRESFFVTVDKNNAGSAVV